MHDTRTAPLLLSIAVGCFVAFTAAFLVGRDLIGRRVYRENIPIHSSIQQFPAAKVNQRQIQSPPPPSSSVRAISRTRPASSAQRARGHHQRKHKKKHKGKKKGHKKHKHHDDDDDDDDD